jgi:hypothetical protein
MLKERLNCATIKPWIAVEGTILNHPCDDGLVCYKGQNLLNASGCGNDVRRRFVELHWQLFHKGWLRRSLRLVRGITPPPPIEKSSVVPTVLLRGWSAATRGCDRPAPPSTSWSPVWETTLSAFADTHLIPPSQMWDATCSTLVRPT